jgi:hypothetical protein
MSKKQKARSSSAPSIGWMLDDPASYLPEEKLGRPLYKQVEEKPAKPASPAPARRFTYGPKAKAPAPTLPSVAKADADALASITATAEAARQASILPSDKLRQAQVIIAWRAKFLSPRAWAYGPEDFLGCSPFFPARAHLASWAN